MVVLVSILSLVLLECITSDAGYIAVTASRTATDAESYCQSTYGTSLATITSADEVNQVRSALSEADITSNAWIGLSDSASEGTFSWNDGTSVYYTNWGTGEPNDFNSGEDCGEVYSYDVWNDEPCTVSQPFVCNYPKYISPIGIKLSWFDANAYCKNKYNTQLATINNNDANKAAYDIGSSANNVTGNIWIGLYDTSEGSNIFEWQDGSSDLIYTNWNSGQPNINNSNWCGEIGDNNSSRWNDESCSLTQYFVCDYSGGIVQLVTCLQRVWWTCLFGTGFCTPFFCFVFVFFFDRLLRLLFNWNSNWVAFENLTYVNSNGCENIDGGGWQLVRHASSSDGTWHSATDNLSGSDTYGYYDNDCQSSVSYSISFNTILFNQFMFAFGDCSSWLVTTQFNAIGENYDAEDRCILNSSESSKLHEPYEALWYNRQAFGEDPWISTLDHSVSSANHTMMYGENSVNGHIEGLLEHNGSNVWIRYVDNDTRDCFDKTNLLCYKNLWNNVKGTWNWADDIDCQISNTNSDYGNIFWVGSSDGTTPNSIYDSNEYDSFIINANLSLDSSGSNNAGILFRTQSVSSTTNGGQSYIFAIYAARDPNEVKIGLFNGGWTQLLRKDSDEEETISIEYDTWYNLKIEAYNNLYNFYIDDDLIWSNVELDDYSLGSFGLRTYLQPATYSYFSIEAIVNDSITSDISYLDNITYVNSNDCENVDGGGWTLVRHVSGTNGAWHPANDQCFGTDDGYGNYSNDAQSSNTWSIAYHNSGFNQFLFAFGDCSNWVVTTRDTAIGSYYEDDERCVLNSSRSDEDAPFYVIWNNRDEYLDDPWISVFDYIYSQYFTLYAENSASDRFEGPTGHGGANVWIRNKTDEETRQCSVTIPYIGVHKHINFTSGETYCNDNFDTSLATITSSEANSFVRDSGTLVGIATYETIWIGLNDFETGLWDTWNDGTSAIYTKWSADEPNNAHGGQDCACMLIENWWDDVGCSAELHFACNSPTNNLLCNDYLWSSINGTWHWTDDASCTAKNTYDNDNNEDTIWMPSTEYYHTDMLFSVSTTLTCTIESDMNCNGMAGIIFRVTNTSNLYKYYYYGLNASSNSIEISIVDQISDKKESILTTNNVSLDFETTYTLKIDSNATLYNFYFDNIIVWSNISLYNYTTGGVGLKTQSQSTIYNYFSVDITTSNPTGAPTNAPSLSPTLNPTDEPTQPTITPSAAPINESTTQASLQEDAGLVETKDLFEQLTSNVAMIVVLLVLLLLILLSLLVAFIHAQTNQLNHVSCFVSCPSDSVRLHDYFTYLLQLWDFLTDVNVCYYIFGLYFRSESENENKSSENLAYLILAILSATFLVVPMFSNIYLFSRKMDSLLFTFAPYNKTAKDSYKSNYLIMVVFCVLSGNFYAALKFVNSGLFGLSALNMGLVRSEIGRFFIYKVFFTTMLESIFQALIAIGFLIVSQNPVDATILLSLVTTVLTLIVTTMQFLRQFDTNVIELNWRLEFIFDSNIQHKISKILRYNRLNTRRFKKQLASELHIDPHRIQIRNIKILGRSSVIIDGLIYSIQLNKDLHVSRGKNDNNIDGPSSLEKAMSISSIMSNSNSGNSTPKFTPNDVSKIDVLGDYVRQWKYKFPNNFVNSKYNNYDMLGNDSCCVLKFAALIDSNDGQLIKDMICRFFFGKKTGTYNDKLEAIKLSYLKSNYMDGECISQWTSDGNIIKFIDNINNAQAALVGTFTRAQSPSTDIFYNKIKSLSDDIIIINDDSTPAIDAQRKNTISIHYTAEQDIDSDNIIVNDSDAVNDHEDVAATMTDFNREGQVDHIQPGATGKNASDEFLAAFEIATPAPEGTPGTQ